MRYLGSLCGLAIVLIILLFSGVLLAAEGWSTFQTRNPPDAVEFKVAYPSAWRPNVMDSEFEVSRGFFHFSEKPFEFQRGVIATGTVLGVFEEPAEDLSLVSLNDLYFLANSILNNVTSTRDIVAKKILSYDLVKISNINSLKVLIENIHKIKTKILYNIHEITIIPYNQNQNNQRFYTNIALHCSYTGRLENRENIIDNFNNEYDKICKTFYDSLEILDKW
jgi:hypothetical protein